MITSVSNNIGIEQVSFKDYQSGNLTILNGRFDVDPSSEAWKNATEIVFDFSSLLMKESADTCVYLIDTRTLSQSEKSFRGTILRSRISGGSLRIEKVDAFDEHGPLRVVVCSAYARGGQRAGIVSDGFVATGISGNSSDTVLKKKCLIVKERYVFCLMTFDGFRAEGGSLSQSFGITGMPSDVDVEIPVIYSNPYISDKGHPLSIGRVSGGHFSCVNPDDNAYTANDGTFLHFFAVRDEADSSEASSEVSIESNE